MHRRPLLHLLIFASAACTGDSGPRVARVDLALQEELRVGGLDGGEAYTFGYVTAVAPSPDRSFYVADLQGPIVRRYDADGRHVADIGRVGEGPGEYRSVYGLGVLGDGRLILWDPLNARLSTYGADGEWESSRPVFEGIGGVDRGFVYSPSGDVYVVVNPERGFDSSDGERPSDWGRIHPDGTLERVAGRPSEDRDGPRYVVSGRGGLYHPFVTMTLSALGPDGSLYEVRNDQFRITRSLPGGDTRVIGRDEARIALTTDEKTEWNARSERLARRNPQRRARYFPIPDFKPYIRELVVDPEGRLWVSRYTEASYMEYSPEERAYRQGRGLASYEWRDKLRWDVFSREDDYVGSVTLPFKTTLMTAVGDAVWGVQAGDLNEDYVVRWRMSRPEASR